MQNWLVKKFVHDYENVHDINVRASYGKLSGKVGIFCNAFLFAVKFIMGTISGSVSITADAVNNLSDAASSVISLIGFKMAEKPADEDHPYGHARYEYLSGLTVAVMIILIGFELFKTSFDKVIHPSTVDFSIVLVIVLAVSILIKLWMAFFNKSLGKKINSSALEATAADSRNDVISTSAVLVAAVISHFFKINLDGYMGIAVAVFILYSGIGLVKDTLDPLLGKAPEPELVDYIQKKILSYDGVLGTHDLMIHDYGPGRKFASVHVEMAAEGDVLKSHDVIDNIERDFLSKDNLNIIVHYDPIVTKDDIVNDFRSWLMEQVKSIDPHLSIHDLRIVPGNSHTNLVFDCVMPHCINMSPSELKAEIRRLVNIKYPNYYCIITIDSSYAAMPHTTGL
ncbi:MAG: cation diffusion facilitator family transporter [Candidatus Metalachnospira sp.]|jgi:cation diffusion facilitator family transporter|nr:cation transporter [Clostridiales bacterium]